VGAITIVMGYFEAIEWEPVYTCISRMQILNRQTFKVLAHYYAADLFIKLHCLANYMRKVSKISKDSILASRMLALNLDNLAFFVRQ